MKSEKGVSRRRMLGGLATSASLFAVARPAYGAAGSGPTPGHIQAEVGTGIPGATGDGVAAAATQLRLAASVVLDRGGNVVFADAFNHRVRRLDTRTGLVFTIAGTGEAGFNGDGLGATETLLNRPTGLAYDPCGNLIVADELNHRVRRVSAATGLVSTVAGTGSFPFNGDGIPGVDANLVYPVKVATDRLGHVFVSDRGHHRIRRIDAQTGVIETYAGTPGAGYNGDGILATDARLRNPVGIWFDCGDNLLIADQMNQRVRQVDASTGLISTIAGTGVQGFNGDGLPATSTDLGRPYKAVADARGTVYFIEKTGQRVRRIDPDTGLVSTVAGTGVAGDDGDEIPAVSARLNIPRDLIIHPDGDLLLADGANHRIRRIVAPS